MNERIKELWEEAAETTQGDSWEEKTKFMERFAELIVRECAQIAKEVDGDEGDDYQSGRTWAGIDVLKHFGVEE